MPKHKFIRKPKKPQIKRIAGVNYDMRRVKVARTHIRVTKQILENIPLFIDYITDKLSREVAA